MNNGTQRPRSAVQYDSTTNQLRISQLDISNPEIIVEAHHWAAGHRGPAVSDERLAQADLSMFARAALDAGTKAIQAAAGTTTIASQHRAITDLAQRAEDASRKAASQIERAANEAEKAAKSSGDETRRIVSQTAEQMRGTVRGALDQAVKDLRRELATLTGEDAPVAAAAKAAVDKAGGALQVQLERKFAETIAGIGRKFDLRDPTSPIGHLATSLREEQDRLASQLAAGHKDLAQRLEQLQTSLTASTAAVRAAEQTVRITPLKGASFEDAVHEAVGKLAAAWGDEYADTARTSGLVSRCMKGDGVLAVLGQPRAPQGVRVVLEMSDSDSARRDWVPYLEECERNRAAHAALGIVRNVGQVPGGGRIRIFGSCRMVIAFDPDRDDPEILQTVLLLLRLQAVLAASRSGAAHVRTAEEKIAEATAVLGQLTELQNTATITRANADKIITGLGGLHARLSRALTEAGHALQDAASDPPAAEAKPGAVLTARPGPAHPMPGPGPAISSTSPGRD